MDGFCTQRAIDRGATLGFIKNEIEVSGRVFFESGVVSHNSPPLSVVIRVRADGSYTLTELVSS